MVAHFYPETVFCVRYTSSPYRDGRLFCRYDICRGGVRGKLCHLTLSRFTGLLVKWANCTSGAAGWELMFALSWPHGDASFRRQDGAPQMLTYQRNWVSRSLQRNIIRSIIKLSSPTVNDCTFKHKPHLVWRCRITHSALVEVAASARQLLLTLALWFPF